MMGWLLVVAVFILLYTLYLAISMAEEYLKGEGMDRIKVKGPVLLVIAHPDDECMFFIPTIRRLSCPVHVLCLSTGNYSDLGEVRRKELQQSCAHLRVGCTVLDDERLQDGPNRWDPADVAHALSSQPNIDEFSAILTFDRYGISGHNNHCDVHTGVRYFAARHRKAFTLLELESVPLWAKYCGPLGMILEAMQYKLGRVLGMKGTTITACPTAVRRIAIASLDEVVGFGYRAMSMHVTQLVWFRYLYLLFSRYMYINTLIIRTPQN